MSSFIILIEYQKITTAQMKRMIQISFVVDFCPIEVGSLPFGLAPTNNVPLSLSVVHVCSHPFLLKRVSWASSQVNEEKKSCLLLLLDIFQNH